jgi:hypothetical protein
MVVILLGPGLAVPMKYTEYISKRLTGRKMESICVGNLK